MKRRTCRRSAIAKLIAAGLALPNASLAAPLNINLVANPSFENVNTSEIGPFAAVRILEWDDFNSDADDTWAFAYSQGYSGTVPPPGAGTYHYSGGFNTLAGETDLYQLIDVSDGPTAATIAAGQGHYDLSAFFSSYLDQDDSTFVRVRFLDSGLNIIDSSPLIGGFAFVSTLGFAPGPFGNQRDWGQTGAGGSIPIGTAAVLVELLSEDSDPNHDGYVDLVSFQVNAVPEPGTFALFAMAGAALIAVKRRAARRQKSP